MVRPFCSCLRDLPTTLVPIVSQVLESRYSDRPFLIAQKEMFLGESLRAGQVSLSEITIQSNLQQPPRSRVLSGEMPNAAAAWRLSANSSSSLLRNHSPS